MTDEQSRIAAVRQVEAEHGAVIQRAVTASRPKARYKVGVQARLLPVARQVLGDRGWDALMRRAVPFATPTNGEEHQWTTTTR